eukprot:6969220-Pyramimonas_sp.AAC.1
MRAMFDLTESESESDTSDLPSNVVTSHNPSQLTPSKKNARLNKKDHWTQHGQSLRRWHFVPRLVALTPVTIDCPVDPGRLADQRRTYAINVRHGLTIDRTDNWRDEDVKYHHPFEQNSNADSSDGDYHP